jgi:crossover junction endodeoxyribonuclease RusA
MIEITLPYPPSANTYYRAPNTGKLAGRHLLSEKGRTYREQVRLICLAQRIKAMTGRLAVHMVAHPPDKRRRDLDNLVKGAQDSLTHGGAWLDDSQIDWLLVERGHVVKDGALRVTIRAMSDVTMQK